jgi:hypothetical protein
MRAHCRTAAATIADLRAAGTSAPPDNAAPWNVLLSRVNHELAALARTTAEAVALRPLASGRVKRDIAAIRRTMRPLEGQLEEIAAFAPDLRVVRRRETVSVLGPRGAPVDVVAETLALEIKTAVFPIVTARGEASATPPGPRRTRLTRRGFVLLLATALLPRRFAVRIAS